MMTKICKRCDSELPIDSGFYANDSSCKECRKRMVRENRAKKLDYYRQYDRKRANLPHRAQARQEYAKTERGTAAHNSAKRAWSERNTIKRAVAIMVNNAVRDGVLVKPDSCTSCGKSGCRIEGHHDDHSKPMEVTWLCSQCHRDWHKTNGPGLNG